MALNKLSREEVDTYARGDLAGGIDEHVARFAFLDDAELRARVGQEYFAARYLYKLWEGLRLSDAWALRAQVQLQVQQYASIYEACLHHLLFVNAADEPQVKALREHSALVARPLPEHLMMRIRALDTADAAEVIGAKFAVRRTQESKVRFEKKVDAAVSLGIIDAALGGEIAEIYSARNSIHIHADLKRAAEMQWQIDFSRTAYRRLKPFTEQAATWMARRASDSTMPSVLLDT
ncbi:hypothetical protein GA0004736_1679 [Curtobacterium sp. 9128]|uniref:hypothetical protein n=1 Tax=Curtobacterium sp. 9128 TaxID=1793722 RepID=UPI0007D738A7|nr:hypothetical protein [Curtobacterium sp. 9128]SBN62771.1 hypothetical protein GA0004736_1679 [Curtobacterium sp. 9128]